MATDWVDHLIRQLTDGPLDLDEVLERIVEQSTRRLRADRGTLYLADHATRSLISRVAHLPEIAEIRLRFGEGVAGWVAEQARPSRVDAETTDTRHARRFDQLTGYHTTSLLAVPLVRDGTVLGVLQLLNHADGAFTDADTEALTRIGAEVVTVLDASSLRSQLQADSPRPLAFRFNHIVGESAVMSTVQDRLQRVARTDVTVLLRGETGTGKGLFAKAVHHNSARRDRPFVHVDCAALPVTLIENELFGHEQGAYTGASGRSEGLVHQAEGGTLFLDEIGELPSSVQSKLLRLLQERRFIRVGGQQSETADVRFIAATHVDLEARIADGTFRSDLYYRLNVVPLHLPALRERGHADLDRLIDHLWFGLVRKHARPDLTLSVAARNRLHAWDWPGNVRELEHCLEGAVVLAPEPTVSPQDLVLAGRPRDASAGFTTEMVPLAALTRAYCAWVLDLHDGNKTAAAEALGIGRNTLHRRLSN